MADITYPTSNVTIYDEAGYKAEVNTDNELLVHDPHVSSDGDRWQTAVKMGRAFTTLNNFVTISGQAETDFMLLTNPNGSTVTAYFEDILYTYNKGAGISIVKMYRSPTITSNGTSQTVLKIKPSGSASNTVVAYYAPTISARGTLRLILGQSAVGTLVYHSDLGVMLEPNSSILFTVQPAANNTDHSLYMEWEEQ